jgi:hypothetical protein
MSLRLNGDTPLSPLSPLMSVPHTPTLHLMDPDFFLGLIPDYLSAVYPVNPVITETEILQCVEHMHNSREACSFLYAFAAVTINLTKTDPMQFAPDIKDQVANLLNRCFDQMEPMHMNSEPSLIKVMRNIFCEICLMGLSKMDLGFYYLREAIAMLQILGVGNADPSFVNARPDKHKLIRAYWECFIHERYTALTDYKPTCLHQLSRLPEHDPSIDPGIEQGWLNLIKTFLVVDDPFINYWVGDRMLVTSEWVEAKHSELEDEQWEQEVHLLTQMQQADLIITRQWLRTLTWQMALSNLFLSSHPSNDAMSLTLPLRLSSQLRHFLDGMRPKDVGIHGTGILQKLFEITITIADVVIHHPDASKEDMLLRADDVLFLKKFVFSFPRIHDSHRVALTSRIEQMMMKYPEISDLEAQYSPISLVSDF